MTLVARPGMLDDDGSFTFGTIVNKTFIDAAYDQIDDQCHSTTNPGIKPKATTDEVVTARGSKATLDTRLDVFLNEDGTPKATANGVAITSQLASLVACPNIAINDQLRFWPQGGALAPNFFTLSGAGAAIVRTGTGEVDTFNFGAGRYAAKLTYGAATLKLLQTIIATANFADLNRVKGRKLSVVVLGKASVGNQLSIVVDDGVTTTRGGQGGNGTFHTGGGAAEVLYATHTISNTATKLEVFVEVAQAGSAYVGGFVFVFADQAPVDWQPLSHGVYRAFNLDSVPPGRLAANGSVNVGNGAGAETDLHTHIVTPSLIDTNGRVLKARYSGTTAANGNVKTIKFYLGTDNITVISAAHNNLPWVVEVELWRITATTQAVVARGYVHGVAQTVVRGAFTRDLATELTAKITGNGAGASDVVAQEVTLELL